MSFLREVPLLAGLSDELLAELGGESRPVHLGAGERLFGQGDAGDAMYLVRTGRLEVLGEDGPRPPVVLRTIGPGQAVGELALLTGAPRSASVRAVRDSELVAIDRTRFAALLGQDPAFAAGLLSVLGEQLRRSGGLPAAVARVDRTFSVVSLDPAVDVHAVAGAILGGLRVDGSAAVLDRAGLDPSGHAEALQRCEADHDRVLLVADGVAAPDDAWTRLCLHQADRLVVLAGPGEPPASAAQAGRADLGLCLVRPEPARVAPWLDAVEPAARHLLRPGHHLSGDGARCARRLTGRSLGVVLSGGGARALAHIGVLAALRDAGLTIDRVGGTSMGALVGAMFATGMDPAAVHEVCRAELVRGRPFGEYAVPRVALLRPRRIEAMLERIFGDRTFEELATDLFTVSADLRGADLVVHRRGPLAGAVRASMSVPGWLPPVRDGARLLVDGGVLDNLPIEAMADTGEGPVIAVDAMGRRLAAGSHDDGGLPSAIDTIARATVLGSWRAVEAGRARAALTITPRLGEAGMRDFDRLDELAEAGRRAAASALEAAGPDWIGRLPGQA